MRPTARFRPTDVLLLLSYCAFPWAFVATSRERSVRTGIANFVLLK